MNSQTKTADCKRVLDDHLQAISSGDMDSLMHDYTDESILITSNGSFKGLSAIKDEFIKLLKDYPPGSTFNLMKQIIHEDYILLIWAGESKKIVIPFAADTFVIKNGKIIFQSFAGRFIPKLT